MSDLAPGSIIEWKCPQSDNVHRWRVLGVHLGAVGQESLIEMESLTHKPGWTGEWEWHPRLWIPEVLIRHLPIVEQS